MTDLGKFIERGEVYHVVLKSELAVIIIKKIYWKKIHVKIVVTRLFS